jgi:AraC family transcriptional regulator of adaptative response / DNA-3-methyladenine glycosylase II
MTEMGGGSSTASDVAKLSYSRSPRCRCQQRAARALADRVRKPPACEFGEHYVDGIAVLEPEVCYRALQARDERFDGRFFVGVVSTGIYCRPVCPAVPAKLHNCRFFPSAAAAQEAGFRPCLRCRPETAPDGGSWRGTSNTAARGLALIAEGRLDREGASVDDLAECLGVSGRQLRRLFMRHLGASPMSVAQTRRVLFAKQLIHETHLPMAEVAVAAGFGSVRRFNETFQQLYGRPPTALRRAIAPSRAERTAIATGVTVRLAYRCPYDWSAILSHLRARAIEGVEWADDASYRRTVRLEGRAGTVRILHRPDIRSLVATIRFPRLEALSGIVARIHNVFDLGADILAIGAHLARDPSLSPLIAKRPGLRSPGGWDGFELAVRAVLGQQVTVEAARQLGARLCALCGTRVPGEATDEPPLIWAFPTAAQLVDADLSSLGMPRARQRTVAAVAHAFLKDPLLFRPLPTLEQTVAKLCAIDGIGEWTAHYIALRAAREPDAFPADDAGLMRAAAGLFGERLTVGQLRARAECWRPWRGYAAQHLWAAVSRGAAKPTGEPS